MAQAWGPQFMYASETICKSSKYIIDELKAQPEILYADKIQCVLESATNHIF